MTQKYKSVNKTPIWLLERNDIIMNEVFKSVTKSDFFDGRWSCKDTYFSHIAMSDKLIELFSDLIENDDCYLMVEYWKDENSFHYLLGFDDDTVSVNDKMECEYLNDLVLEIANENSV